MDKDEVRRLFPHSVAFADECRRVFGDGVKLVYAKEGGREIGNRVVHDPENVVRLSEMDLDTRPMCEIVAVGSGKRGGKRGK